MFGSRRVLPPHPYKQEPELSRIRQVAGIVVRNGSSRVNFSEVSVGQSADEIHMYSFSCLWNQEFKQVLT